MIVSASLVRKPSHYDVIYGIVMVTVLLVGGVGLGRNAISQDELHGETAEPGSEASALADRVRGLVEELRSGQFAAREDASEQLFRLGHDALPILRDTRRSSSDTEQNDRLDRIIKELAEQDLESRIHAFLKGDEAELQNWSEVEKWFGDSARVRELFVDLYREHPDLVSALGGTPQQLSIGLAKVRRRLMQRGVGPRETPQRIDLIALLLPMVEPNFDAGPQYDIIVASLLQYYNMNEFRNDVVFGKPFTKLVTQWMVKSDLSVREQVLRLAMQWRLPIGLKLALETIPLGPDPILLCRCMQTISRQGDPTDASMLVKYLDDATVVYRRRHHNLQGVFGSDVQVRDVAAAAIARLAAVPVTKVGFAEPAEHEIFGIIYEELVVPMKPEDEMEKDPKVEDDDEKKADPRLEGIRPGDPFPLGQRAPTWEQMRELSEQARRRDAMRDEIRAKVLELVPKSDVPPEPKPAAPVEKG